jgi:hypothetical protein
MVFGEVSEPRMISVLLLAIGIAFQNHRLHVVYKDFHIFSKRHPIGPDSQDRGAVSQW